MRIAVLIALALACAAPAAAEIPNPDDAIAVSGIVQDRLRATDISVQMVAEKPYIVAYWSAGKNYSAGQALTKKAKSGWTIVKIIDGKFTASALVALGTPEPTAKALAADLKVAGQ
ncbi:MAG TPA: hypothetical protein VMU38_10455 [Candidatus Binatia bacterium]|nr:hypothetical protein [Candidatus Binatia bacterium]